MRICKVKDCTDKYHAKEYCQFHYDQSVKGYEPGPRVRLPSGTHTQCTFNECERPHSAKGYCITHWTQLNRGQELKPIKKISPRGTGHLNKDGYVTLGIDGRTYLEHKLVMENHLGRKLLPDENIHHINGVRNDNRLENLELWCTSQPKGQRVQDKILWAREILSRYDNYDMIAS